MEIVQASPAKHQTVSVIVCTTVSGDWSSLSDPFLTQPNNSIQYGQTIVIIINCLSYASLI